MPREGVEGNVRDHPNVVLQFRIKESVPASDTDGDKFPRPWLLRYTAAPLGDGVPVSPHDMIFYNPRATS